MARISEIEFLSADTVELALTPAEYNAMIAANGTIKYQISTYQHTGVVRSTYAFPTAASGFQLDPDTNEYIAIVTYPTTQNNLSVTPNTAATNYEGVGLSVVNGTITTPIEGYYVGSSNTSAAAYTLTVTNGPLAGTTFKYVSYNQIPNPNGGGGSVRWDYPNPTRPILGAENFYNTGVLCFVAGSLIETPNGQKDVAALAVGDLVKTLDNSYQSILWIGSRTISKQELEANPKLYPVRITAGSLGLNLPQRDLLVSRQHRVLLNLGTPSALHSESESLIAAIRLTKLPGIYVDESVEFVEYVHFLCDNHEIVFAEHVLTETLFTGAETLKTLSPEAVEELMTVIPQLAEANYQPKPARLLSEGFLQKQLVDRYRERALSA